MTKRQLQRHDPFFRRLLEQPAAAGALLRERLPPEVAALLANDPPELVPGSFVSGRLRAYRTDRLFRTRTISGSPVLILTLIEHKSKPDPRIGLQLLGYQCQILERWAAHEGKTMDGTFRPLPALVTLVVYNGAENWNVPLTLAEATEADAAIRPWVLDFRYTLLSLKSVPDARLSAEKVLRVGLLVLKHGIEARQDRERLTMLLRSASALGEDDLVTLVYYLVGDPDGPDADTVRAILDELMPDDGERIMSTAAEQWKAEGFNLGLIQGEIKGEARGEAKGKATMFMRQLRRRFPTLPDAIESRVRDASSDQLDEWSERFVDARTLADIFDTESSH